MAHPDTLFQQAARHHEAGRLPEAEKLYKKALAANRNHALSRYGIGMLNVQLNRLEDAAGHLTKAVKLLPDNGEIWFRLGQVEMNRQRFKEGAHALEQANRLAPNQLPILGALGTALFLLEMHPNAEPVLEQAVALAPDNTELLTKLGITRFHLDHHDAAIATLERALALNPDLALAHFMLGRSNVRLHRYEAAWTHFERALALEPDNREFLKTLLYLVCYDPGKSPADVAGHIREWGKKFDPPTPPSPCRNDPDPERPLRIGYLSPDLREHAVVRFFEPVLAHHDRGNYPVTCYANVAKPDRFTRRLKGMADGWVDTTGMDDAALAGRIRDDGIDVLVDLAGHTAGSRIHVMPHRPAPVQGTWLGYPVTSGLSGVDFRLTTPALNPPGSEAYYTEKLVHLPDSFCCFLPPDAPEPGPVPAEQNGYVTFGSTMNPDKVNLEVIALWARVLSAVPGSRLRLGRYVFASDSARTFYQSAFAEHGIAPERILCEGTWSHDHKAFLAVYNKFDICLDTFPYNGHTTTCEALWMGVPTVTMVGKNYVDRVGMTLLRTVGLEELVAEDRDDFVARAAALASDPDRLAALHGGLRERLAASSLCDGPKFAGQLEETLRTQWRGWCKQADAS